MSVLTWILIVVSMIVAFIATLFGFIYIVTSAISSRNEVIGDAWAYWEEKKRYRWEKLSEDEKEKILQAYMVIQDDCGGCDSIDKIKELMKEQLPILESQLGMSHPMAEDCADK